MRILIGSIASAALLAQAQVSPDARDLLMRSGGAAATANTVRMQGTESSELVYGATSRENSGSFSLAVSGARTRLETKFVETSPGSAEASELSIVDGTSRWRYNRAANVYWQYPAPAGPTNDVLGRIRFSRDPAGFRDGKILRQETMEFGGLQTPCFVVHAAYSKLPGNATAIDVERTVWIAKSNYLVLRDVWEFTMDAAASLSMGKSRVTTDYTAVEWDIPLADDLFVFHPPDGSRQATPSATASPALARAASGLKGAVLTHGVEPAITAEARAAGLQGTVSLYVEVGGDGRPSQVEAMEGLGLGLDEQAVRAVQQWTFQPRPGVPDDIQDILDVDVSYRLDPPAPWFVESESFLVNLPDRQRIDEVIRPVATHYAAPDAAACTAAGKTAVRLTVGRTGKPLDVHPADSAGLLADAAVKAVQSWHFTPGTVNGSAMESHGRVAFSCRPAGDVEKTAAELAYRIGGGVSAPVLLSKVEPEYSVQARKSKWQGTSMLYVQISPEGKAGHIHVVKKLGMGLDRQAMEAVKQWRFTPGMMRDGTPITVEATIEVNFRLL
jgi:TonB family protein